MHPPLKYTLSNTKDRVAKSISQACPYTHEPANEKMRSDPQFRKNHREKWQSPKDFIMGYKNKTIVPINNYSVDVSDPFMGGREKVIAMTSRSVNKSKNVSDVEFSAVISKDPFQYNKNNQSSLRSLGGILMMKNSGIAGDISSFTKVRKSMNHSKSVPKLIDVNRNTNDTIQEILADFGQFPNKSLKIKSQLKGTQNKRYLVNKDIDDKDVLDLITSHKKVYHMSAYDAVKQPEIVVRNKQK